MFSCRSVQSLFVEFAFYGVLWVWLNIVHAIKQQLTDDFSSFWLMKTLAHIFSKEDPVFDTIWCCFLTLPPNFRLVCEFKHPFSNTRLMQLLTRLCNSQPAVFSSIVLPYFSEKKPTKFFLFCKQYLSEQQYVYVVYFVHIYAKY